MKRDYIPRVADAQVDESLRYSGAVHIEGVKGCGKTQTSMKRSKSAVFLYDPERSGSYLKIAATKPSILLNGDVPRLIDEWQAAPALWNAVKYEVDERGEPGQFILTGSVSVPHEDKLHSGAGRFSRVLMSSMSLFESSDSSGTVSLSDLFAGTVPENVSELTVEAMTAALIRGGWPQTIGESPKYAQVFMRNYTDMILYADVSSVDGVKRDPDILYRLMRSLSGNISASASIPAVQKDMGGTVSEKTVSGYINALRRIHIVEDLPAWNPSLRSSASVRTSPKRHFADPAIAAAVMRANANDLLMDFNTLGLFFESLCIRDLRVYAQAIDGAVFQYRDSNGLEIDAIIRLGDGRWGAAEIKLGTNEIGKASKNLLKLKDSIDNEKMRQPSFLMVLTAGEYAYVQDDGIMVVPIGCLRD